MDDGAIQWELSLSQLGLDDYGAVRSAVGAPVSAIGVDAGLEGDARPPVVLGVDTATGEVVWRTTLIDGTDLNWGSPPVSDGQTLFTSTSSQAGSTEENRAHLIDLADGSIVWTADMGDGQGFGEESAVFGGLNVHLPAYREVLTVARGDGGRRWSRTGHGAVLADAGLWMFDADRSLELVDPNAGEVIRELASPVAEPARLVDLGEGLLGVFGEAELVVIDEEGGIHLRHQWPDRVVDIARLDRDELLIATDDARITAYSIGPTSDPASEESTQGGSVEVAYGGLRFEVPSSWPIMEVDDGYTFTCASFEADGVYLPPADLDGTDAYICPSTESYSMTLHVFPQDRGGVPPDDAEVVGEGDDVRWVRQTATSSWRSVTLPMRGVRFEFYETPEELVESIVASVRGHR